MTEPVQIETPATPAPPSTPAEASARLDALRSDSKWTASLLSGGPAETKEFHTLHELASKGDSVDMAIGGVLQPGVIQNSEHMQNIGAAEMLRELGIRDDVIRETLQGKSETKPWYDETVRWKADHMSNPDWVKRLMSGDVEARRQLMLANIIITGGITGESAA